MADRKKSPPPEAMSYLEAKGFKSGFHWQDVWGDEHAMAFTVAKATQIDALSTLRNEVERAVRDGVPFEQWRKDLEPTLTKLGWWGKQFRMDPLTGEKVIVQLGSPRRLKTIYWANTRTAYAAGQYERAQRTKRALPYFVYELGPSENHRPHHEAWANAPTILPVDDPFWDSHYPPNGWLCKCRLRQITRFEASALKGPTKAPSIDRQEFINKRTGEATQVPVGIDPGWHTSPGKLRAQNINKLMTERLDALDENRRRIAVHDLANGQNFKAIQRGDFDFSQDDRSPVNSNRGAIAAPIAVITDDMAKAISVKTRTVLFSVADAEKQGRKRVLGDGSQQFTPNDYMLVQQLLDTGDVDVDEVVQNPRDLIAIGELSGKHWFAVLRRTLDGSRLFLKSFRRTTKGKYEKHLKTRRQK